jgi:hypothetical protein
MKAALDALLVAANLYNPVDPRACAPYSSAPIEGICALPSAGLLWLAALVPLGAIAY